MTWVRFIETSTPSGGWIVPKRMLKPVGEHEGVALAEVVGDRGAVEAGLYGVRGEQHHDVTPFGSRVRGIDAQALRLRPLLRRATRPQADPYLDTAVAQVQGVSVTLAAVADDGNALSIQMSQIGIGVVVGAGHLVLQCGRRAGPSRSER